MKSCLIYVKIKKNSYFYNYSITNFQVNSTDHTKDTLEFMFTMCTKTEWIREAILLNKFNTDHFIWIDFGIRQVFGSDEELIKKLNSLNKTYPSVRIGRILNLNYIYNIDIYKDVAWYLQEQ
jgi:hypothetical protein